MTREEKKWTPISKVSRGEANSSAFLLDHKLRVFLGHCRVQATGIYWDIPGASLLYDNSCFTHYCPTDIPISPKGE